MTGPVIIITLKILIFNEMFAGTLLNSHSLLLTFGAIDMACVYSFMFNLAVECYIVMMFERHLCFALHFHMLLH